MSTHTYSIINPSILIGELPLEEQLRLVRNRGFRGVELWWPFETATPSDSDVDAVLTTIADSRLRLVGMNLYEGGMALGNRGITCWPGVDAEFDASIEVGLRFHEATGVQNFNVLHGTLNDRETRDAQNERAAVRTARAADAFSAVGGVVTIEQLSHIPGYGLRTMAEVTEAVARARERATTGTVLVQIDLFHMFNMGDDVAGYFRDHWREIGHVQVADFPGRGAPGTGEQPIDELLALLRGQGYRREIALEYSHYENNDPFAHVTVAC
ncbi:hydroxypyruvate isomerase [Microbacterium keratanolyticum]|uniref:Hydroxypyruvate isomerase n=1 Tax=Microbacterium keratanolyticum TaxID=67574 RepID=A0A9W6M817_9MICO|nr:TIM barrel protein [Microbacterium keratanolyticum]MBM7468680.1 hydroxypyruvate isomerase [Microbacterium keratanolyticum]GLK00756.1 hydroxypyruvate isomerase [Microbacterium keratanolyticum]